MNSSCTLRRVGHISLVPNQFLSNIKRLNDHAQTRDETLARAQEIFGAENSDLFGSFTSLLSKHGLT